jgi:hypothetical protein
MRTFAATRPIPGRATDPALDAQYPAAWPARVEITLADGRTLAAATQYAKIRATR